MLAKSNMIAAALIFFLMGTFVPLSVAFIPTKLLAWSINGLNPPLREVSTHSDITKNALRQVSATLLSEHKRARRRNSRDGQQGILDEYSLVAKYYGSKRRLITREVQEATQAIVDANIMVDLEDDTFLDAASHFDSEQFQAGQERLIKKRRNVVTQILSSNFAVARKECGQMLHGIQDFYSHSNWLENGNEEIYSVLGKPGKEISHVVDHRTQTCNNCENGRTVFSIDILNSASMIFRPYSCHNNILKDLKSNGTLTSGYSDQVRIKGWTIPKPLGKCSHGGFLDKCSSLQAQGGINKDSPFEVWSPHYYLHDKAVAMAQEATVSILEDIRKEVDNDELFALFLGLQLGPKSSDEVDVKYVFDIDSNWNHKFITSIIETRNNRRARKNQYYIHTQDQLLPLSSTGKVYTK